MADLENCVIEPPHFTYIWTLENMCIPCCVGSPVFTVKEMELTKWYLWIDHDNSEFVEPKILRDEDDGPNSIGIKFDLAFLGKDGLPLIEKEGIMNFTNDDSFEFYEFADKNKVFFQRRAEFLPKDTLTVRCRMWRIGTGILQLDACFARTRLIPDHYFFIWNIREFSTLKWDQKVEIQLNVSKSNQLTFNLFVTEKDGKEFFSIGIHNSLVLYLKRRNIKISLLDFEGKVAHFKEIYEHVDGQIDFKNFFEKAKFMDDKENLLPNDVLSLRCELEMDAKVVWSVIENYRYSETIGSHPITTDAGHILLGKQDDTSNVSCSFTQAMKSLIEEGLLSDVNLKTDSKSFAAHKCILSARSPVFKAMFSGDMKEKTSMCVEIPDVNEDTLKELLLYIYTDKVGELEWRDVADLFRAADKYELLDLKRRCATYLKSSLSVRNACAILAVADLHHDQELRENAKDFIMHQGMDFFTSDEWSSFKEDHSEMYVEILECIVCNMKNRH